MKHLRVGQVLQPTPCLFAGLNLTIKMVAITILNKVRLLMSG